MNKEISTIQIKDIMTTDILAAQKNDSILEVAKTLVEKDFNGLPVIDKNYKLVGMITLRELIDNKGHYLPTMVEIINEIKIDHPNDVAKFQFELKNIKDLTVEGLMNTEPVCLVENAGLETAAEALIMHNEDILPVVDKDKKIVGVVTRYDILKTISRPFKKIDLKPQLTREYGGEEMISDLAKNFVLVRKKRAKFWYVTALAFLILGIAISIALIIRVRIR